MTYSAWCVTVLELNAYFSKNDVKFKTACKQASSDCLLNKWPQEGMLNVAWNPTSFECAHYRRPCFFCLWNFKLKKGNCIKNVYHHQIKEKNDQQNYKIGNIKSQLSIGFFWNRKSPLKLHKVHILQEQTWHWQSTAMLHACIGTSPHSLFFLLFLAKNLTCEKEKRGSSGSKQDVLWAQKGKVTEASCVPMNRSMVHTKITESFQESNIEIIQLLLAWFIN